MKTREHLLLAALDTFYSRGVARASLNEIAQAAGVTRGALYWHFKNKEDLFDALFQHICNDFNTKTATDINNISADAWQGLRYTLINLFEQMQSNVIHQKFISILYLKCEHTEENQAIVNLMHRYNQLFWHDQLYASLQQCIDQGKLPANLNIEAAAIYLKSLCSGLMRILLTDTSKLDTTLLIPAMIDTALQSLKHSMTLRHPGKHDTDTSST
ncbi:TetR family transcriptional regulator [Neisseria arctica]|nr:TetR family transcriptional regulator [Neisseria arctica]UOO87067.1 TetR family transcriptional regulator [Neisseria arctica]